MTEVEALTIKLARMQDRLRQVEQVIEDRSREIFFANQNLERAASFLQHLYQAMPEPLVVVHTDGRIETTNDAARALCGWSETELRGQPCELLFATAPVELHALLRNPSADEARMHQVELVWKGRAGELIPILFSATRLQMKAADGSGLDGAVCVALDLRTRKKLELSLRQAQKLESVGRLAAGVAHEINTPVQFVADSLHFVSRSYVELRELFNLYREAIALVPDTEAGRLVRTRLSEKEEEIDLDYLSERVPVALERCTDGLGRVAGIVRSMKDFAHPEQKEMSLVDLNRSVESTLVIARHEYKYIAELTTELGEVPKVMCHGGDINQVVLNIIVNASHAIAEVVHGTNNRGHITVKTWREGDNALISIADDGAGIASEISGKLYDPFFTTKPMGKGTGQGLSIARTVVEERHGGQLWFESTVGRGTTFFIRLPIHGRARASRPGVAA